jgi:hypothetical protein
MRGAVYKLRQKARAAMHRWRETLRPSAPLAVATAAWTYYHLWAR